MIKKLVLSTILLFLVAVIAILLFLPAIIDKQMNAVSEHEAFTVSEKAKQLHRTLVTVSYTHLTLPTKA